MQYVGNGNGRNKQQEKTGMQKAKWVELQILCENMMLRRVYTWGPPGVGKSRFGMDVLKKNFKTVYQITLNDDISVQELLGHYIPKGNEFVWHDGPIALAMRDPNGALLINELPRASGAVRDLMLGVLDDNSIASIALPTGEMLYPHARFTVMATGNDKPEECLTEALIDRFELVLELQSPNPALIEKLNKVRPCAGTLVERSYHSTTNFVSPRKMISFLTLTSKRSDLLTENQAAELVFGNMAGEIQVALALLPTEKAS